MTSAILDVCRDHFGMSFGGGRWSPPNRCGSCPLRAPCLRWGSAPAHTVEQFAEARATFAAEAEEILAGGAR